MLLQTMTLPKSLEEITPQWLSEALSARWPGIEVAGVNIVEVLHGAATKVRLAMDYANVAIAQNAGTPPATMWLKIGFEKHDAIFNETGIYQREAFFYGEIRSRLDLRLPECYFAGVQYAPSQFALLLEDLLDWDAKFSVALQPLSVIDATAALTSMAALHAQSWHNTAALAAAGVPVAMTETLPVFDTFYKPQLDQFFASVRGYAVPVALHDKARLLAAIDAYIPFVRQNHCMTHGDLHVGNSFKLPD